MSDLNNDIINYHNGKLTPEEMHALERKALDDPFLAEALEGSSQISPQAFSEDIMALSSRLNKEIHKTPAGQVPPSLWSWPLRIAAGLVILISATVVFFALRFEEGSDTIALNEEVHSPVPEQSISSSDSSANNKNDQGIASASVPVQPKQEKATPQLNPGAEIQTYKKDALTSQAPVSPSVGAAEKVTESEPAKQAKTEEQLAVATPELEDRPAVQAPSASPSDKRKQYDSESDEKSSTLRGYTNQKPAVSNEESKKQLADVSKNGPLRVGVPMESIKGQVFDPTGAGLPGVNVVIKGTNIGTITDATGSYEIIPTKADPTLVYSSIGYGSHEEDAAGKKEINISLDEDAAQLSEVVVTGYGVTKDDSDITIPLELAAPEGGRRAYKQYLEKNLQYPERALGKNIEGKVTVQFAVEPNGELSDFRVIKGIGDGCDEEVIRLIKSGPKWNPTTRDTEKLRGTVRVRMRFQLPKKK